MYSDIDALVRNYETEISANVPLSTEKDIRIYVSCILRSCFSCFQQMIIDDKYKNVQNSKPTFSSDSFDYTSLYRIAGAVLRKMLKNDIPLNSLGTMADLVIIVRSSYNSHF